jgi:hypothetical protein
MRPKPAKLLTNPVLREYVQDRLAGNIATSGGKSIAGPKVEWKGRRHGPRQARRWSQAWSPEQIANRLGGVNYLGRRIDSSVLLPELTRCLT